MLSLKLATGSGLWFDLTGRPVDFNAGARLRRQQIVFVIYVTGVTAIPSLSLGLILSNMTLMEDINHTVIHTSGCSVPPCSKYI